MIQGADRGEYCQAVRSSENAALSSAPFRESRRLKPESMSSFDGSSIDPPGFQ
jgi:hypothetical protein